MTALPGVGEPTVSPEAGGWYRVCTRGPTTGSCPPALEASGALVRSLGHVDRALSARGRFSEEERKQHLYYQNCQPVTSVVSSQGNHPCGVTLTRESVGKQETKTRVVRERCPKDGEAEKALPGIK